MSNRLYLWPVSQPRPRCFPVRTWRRKCTWPTRGCQSAWGCSFRRECSPPGSAPLPPVANGSSASATQLPRMSDWPLHQASLLHSLEEWKSAEARDALLTNEETALSSSAFHLFIHTFIHSWVDLFVRSLSNQSFIHSLIRSFIHLGYAHVTHAIWNNFCPQWPSLS